MRRLLLLAALSLCPLANCQNTPNLGFSVPPTNQANWGPLINGNFAELDSILSGNQSIPGLSVTGPLTAPQLTTWLSATSYSQGALVVYLGLIYQSQSSANQANIPGPTSTFWSTSITASAAAAFSNENLPFSATPTFSLATTSSRIALSGAMAFTLAAGTDGQQKCLYFVHDNTTNAYTVTPPANVFAFMPKLGLVRAQQCFTFYALDTLWVANSPGVTQ